MDQEFNEIPKLDSEKVLRRFEALEGGRGQFEAAWRQCSDYVLPRLGRDRRNPGLIFDSTAPLALGRFASALEAILTPRGQKWHGLSPVPAGLERNSRVAAYLEEVRDLIFANRLDPEANFYNQIVEAYLSLGVHGTAVLLVDEEPGQGLRYQCIPIYEVYLAQNAAGRVDTVFRAYRLTARQAAAEFGDSLPEEICRDAESPANMEREHEFIHGVFPRGDFDPRRHDALNMPWASVHLARGRRRIVRESGYRTMPYAVSRFTVAPGEVYGRSPAMEVMPDIVQVNAMKKTMLRAAEKMVNPPLLTPEDDVLTAFSLKAGSINYGGLDEQGRQRVVPLQIGGNLPIGMEMINEARQTINEAFYINLFQILVETPQKTATEVMERAQEKAQLLAPVMGRQQSELLRPIIEREVDILSAAGVIPPPPEEMARLGGEVLPRYESSMAAALAGSEGTAVLQAFQGLAALAQHQPDVLDNIDFDQAGRIIIRSFGAPAAICRDEASVEQMRREKSEAAAGQEEQLAQMMGGVEAGLAGAPTNMQEVPNV